MYFALLPGYHNPPLPRISNNKIEYIKNNNEQVINFLNNFSEVEKIQPWKEKGIEDEFTYYGISKRNLRKLKILSLSDDKIKNTLTELEKLVSNKNRVHIYGEKKPDFNYYTTSSYSGSGGSNGVSGTSGVDPIQNRFAKVKDLKKHFDFYRIKNQNVFRNKNRKFLRKV